MSTHKVYSADCMTSLVIRYNVYILKDSKNSNRFLEFRECA